MYEIPLRKPEKLRNPHLDASKFTHAALMITVLDTPVERGFKVSELRDRANIISSLEAAVEANNSSIVFTQNELDTVKTAFENFPWGVVETAILVLQDDLNMPVELDLKNGALKQVKTAEAQPSKHPEIADKG